MTHTPTKPGFWYLWNKETDEITDAHDTYKTWEDLALITEDPESRKMKADNVGKYWVSTVFFGIDYNFANPEKDISKGVFFETMIFNHGDVKEDEPKQPFQNRYHTAQEARAGHDKTVMKLKAALDKDPDNIDWDSFYEQQPSETCRDENQHV